MHIPFSSIGNALIISFSPFLSPLILLFLSPLSPPFFFLPLALPLPLPPSLSSSPSLPLQAEQMKQAAIISSSGDSLAAELLSKAFQEAGDGLIELRRLEAAEEIAKSLSKSRNVAYLPSGGSGGGSNLLLSIPP